MPSKPDSFDDLGIAATTPIFLTCDSEFLSLGLWEDISGDSNLNGFSARHFNTCSTLGFLQDDETRVPRQGALVICNKVKRNRSS